MESEARELGTAPGGQIFKSGIYMAGDGKTLQGFKPTSGNIRFGFYKDLSECTLEDR